MSRLPSGYNYRLLLAPPILFLDKQLQRLARVFTNYIQFIYKYIQYSNTYPPLSATLKLSFLSLNLLRLAHLIKSSKSTLRQFPHKHNTQYNHTYTQIQHKSHVPKSLLIEDLAAFYITTTDLTRNQQDR